MDLESSRRARRMSCTVYKQTPLALYSLCAQLNQGFRRVGYCNGIYPHYSTANPPDKSAPCPVEGFILQDSYTVPCPQVHLLNDATDIPHQMLYTTLREDTSKNFHLLQYISYCTAQGYHSRNERRGSVLLYINIILCCCRTSTVQTNKLLLHCTLYYYTAQAYCYSAVGVEGREQRGRAPGHTAVYCTGYTNG